MPASKMTKEYGVLRFRGTSQFYEPLALVFESDDPAEVMVELARFNGSARPETGYLVVCKGVNNRPQPCNE